MMGQSRETTQRNVDSLYRQLHDVLAYMGREPLDSEREAVRARLENLLRIVSHDTGYREGISRLNDEGYAAYEKMLRELYYKMTMGKRAGFLFDSIIDNPVFKGQGPIHEQRERGYEIIQAEFPWSGFDGFSNQLEALGFVLNSLKWRQPNSALEQLIREQIPFRNESAIIQGFSRLSAYAQIEYLYRRYGEGMGRTGHDRGMVAKHLRNLRNGMKLRGLFSLEPSFMNVKLRDFLNLNDDGTEIYTWDDMRRDGWSEYSSILSQYHQMTASNIGLWVYHPNKPVFVYIRLNAKFGHSDGREVVFAYKSSSDGLLITDYPDKGTYNYRSGPAHTTYDVKPYNDLMSEHKANNEGFRERMNFLTEQNGGDKANSYGTNSFFWQFRTPS